MPRDSSDHQARILDLSLWIQEISAASVLASASHDVSGSPGSVSSSYPSPSSPPPNRLLRFGAGGSGCIRNPPTTLRTDCSGLHLWKQAMLGGMTASIPSGRAVHSGSAEGHKSTQNTAAVMIPCLRYGAL